MLKTKFVFPCRYEGRRENLHVFAFLRQAADESCQNSRDAAVDGQYDRPQALATERSVTGAFANLRETVGFQFLSLRQIPLTNQSLTQRAARIPKEFRGCGR